MVLTALIAKGQDTTKQAKEMEKPAKKKEISFKNDVFPILEKNCIPCHAEENFNPSELSLDTYELLKKGGKNGDVYVPGKPDESNLVLKLSVEPPFGDRMPLNSKKKIKEGKAKFLSDDDVKTIATWIKQGAKKN